MIETHLNTMQPPPPRRRARARALEWLSDRSAPLCEAEPGEADHDALLYADDALDTSCGRRTKLQPVARPISA